MCVLRSDCLMNISFYTRGLFHNFSTKLFICSTQWKNRVFLVGPRENKPANLQSSCMNFLPFGFSGLFRLSSHFAGFKMQTCKAHALFIPLERIRWFRVAGKKRSQLLPLLIRQSPKLRRTWVAQMAHPIESRLVEERTAASTARLADLRTDSQPQVPLESPVSWSLVDEAASVVTSGHAIVEAICSCPACVVNPCR